MKRLSALVVLIIIGTIGLLIYFSRNDKKTAVQNGGDKRVSERSPTPKQSLENLTKRSRSSKNLCSPYQEPKTKRTDCFGCSNNICTNPPFGWLPLDRGSKSTGIPYSCLDSETGCKPAQ